MILTHEPFGPGHNFSVPGFFGGQLLQGSYSPSALASPIEGGGCSGAVGQVESWADHHEKQLVAGPVTHA